MNHFIIHIENSGLWFSLIMILVFILVNGIFIIKGLLQGSPILNLFLITASSMLFFIIGIHLFPLTGSDLKSVVQHGAPMDSAERSVIGGLLGVLARILSIYFFREKIRLIDNIAAITLAGLGLQNLGCFFQGCCYGSVSTLPWAVTYSAGTPAYIDQINLGLLSPAALASIPIHPVQIYLLLACLAGSFFVIKAGKRLKAPMSAFFLAIILYTFLRFTAEFFRDPLTNNSAGIIVWGIKKIQWTVLFLSISFGILLVIRERNWKEKRTIQKTDTISLWRSGLLLFFLLLVNWRMQGMFEFAEKVILYGILSASGISFVWVLFKTNTLPGYRMATATVILLACMFMSQDSIPSKRADEIVYTEIGGGMQFGKFYNTIYKNMGAHSSCNGSTYYATGNPKMMKYNSSLGAGSISQTKCLSKYKRFQYGLNIYFGNIGENGIDTVFHDSYRTFGLQPYLTYSGRWIGIGGGFHLGELQFANLVTKPNSSNINRMVGEMKKFKFFPSLYFRLGPYDIFYVDFNLSNHFPSASPLMFSSFSLGTGLGRTDGRLVSLGVSSAGYFGRAKVPVYKDLYVDALLGYTPKRGNEYNVRSFFSLGINYRFNFKPLSRR
jgi:prolipoprotein diacylglyceryltransferase